MIQKVDYFQLLMALEVITHEGRESHLPYDPEGVLVEGRGLKYSTFKILTLEVIVLTLQLCLQELKTWSDQNPGHLPVFITFNAKDSPLPIPEAAKANSIWS